MQRTNQQTEPEERRPDPALRSLNSRRHYALLVLVLVLAAALRLHGLGSRDVLWEDEVGLWSYAVTGDASNLPHEPPLYAWLLFAWMWWTHDPATSTLQLLSIALGILDVAAAYVLGRLVAGARVGIGAAALTAIAPLALYLSHEVRPYTLFILTSSLLLAAYGSAWKRDDARAWLLYGAALLAAMHSHLLISQVCIALGVTALGSLWIERERPRGGARFLRFAATSLLAGGAGIVWIALRPQAPWINQGPHTDGAGDFLLRSIQTLGGSRPTLTILSLSMTALAGAGLVRLARRRATLALLLASVIAICGAITFATMAPVSGAGWLGWQRYLSHLLIPFLVLVATGSLWLADLASSGLAGKGAVAVRAAVALVPLMLVAPGTLHWLDNPNRHPGAANLKQHASFISARQRDAKGVLLYERVHSGETWLSLGPARRRDGLALVRHDSLPTYGIGAHGLYGLQKMMGRGAVAEILRPVLLDQPPEDGPYIVFPPSVGCRALTRSPLEGVRRSRRVERSTWGRVCDIEFDP